MAQCYHKSAQNIIVKCSTCFIAKIPTQRVSSKNLLRISTSSIRSLKILTQISASLFLSLSPSHSPRMNCVSKLWVELFLGWKARMIDTLHIAELHVQKTLVKNGFKMGDDFCRKTWDISLNRRKLKGSCYIGTQEGMYGIKLNNLNGLITNISNFSFSSYLKCGSGLK